MEWKKLGRIFTPKNFHPMAVSHAANPVVVGISENTVRVYYSPRNSENKSSVSFFDFDMDTLKTTYINKIPVVQFGDSDSFYSHGVSVGCHYVIGDCSYLLFMGWQIPANEHWRGDIGRIAIKEGGTPQIDPKVPFIHTEEEDPVSLSYPWVLFENGLFYMWYGSTVTWKSENGEMIHVIKQAISKDGVNWEKKGIAIPFKVGEYQAFSRPTVIRIGDTYHMWYSFRANLETKYRIGYAYSYDLKLWTVDHKKTGITVSDEGWDHEMVCYPCVFSHAGQVFMMYNGNDYGKTGIGLAVLMHE